MQTESSSLVTSTTHIDDHFQPFIRIDYPIKNPLYEYSKMILVTLLLLPIRLIVIVHLHISFWFLSTLLSLLSCQSELKYNRLNVVFRWIYRLCGPMCRVGLFVVGFLSIDRIYISQQLFNQVQLDQRTTSQSSDENNNNMDDMDDMNTDVTPTIISNHLSMIDIPVLLSEFNVMSFVVSQSYSNVPFYGPWMNQLDCIFVNQERKQGMTDLIVNRQLETSTTRLLIFPEGTTTNGSCLIHFHSGAFKAGLPVQPVIIRYPFNHFSITWETIPVSVYIWRLITQFRHHCQLIHFPVYYPNEKERSNPTLFAENVSFVMSNCVNRLCAEDRYPLGNCQDITRKDKVQFHDLILSGQLSWKNNRE